MALKTIIERKVRPPQQKEKLNKQYKCKPGKEMMQNIKRIFLVFSLSVLVCFYYYFPFQERNFPIISYFFKLKENKTGTSKELYVQFLMGEKSCKNLKSR